MIVRPLTEYCTLNMGQSPDSKTYNTQGKGLPFYQGNADFGETHPITHVWCSAPVKVAEDGDILISVRAPIGAMNMAVERCCIGRGLAALTPIRNKCSKQFLYYALQSKVDSLIAQGTGSTFKAISKKVLEATCIPAYSTIEQEQIAETIGHVDNTIAARRKQLALLDQLVKSRFIELFGDADRFEAAPLDDNVVEMFIGPFGSSLKNECFVAADQGYCMVYEQKHAIKKTMDVDTRYINEKKYKELHRFTVRGGDIIVSCRGTIGETFIIPEGAPFGIMHPSIMKIRLKASAYNRVFFNHLLQTVLDRHAAEANGSGVKMAITATALGKEHFILPPMELQEQFAAFVEQTDKSKLAVQKGLQELEILKKSLMQQYFG